VQGEAEQFQAGAVVDQQQPPGLGVAGGGELQYDREVVG
jgi:hypothetical protein